MFASLSEFKFYQSFRVPVEANDDVRFLIEEESDLDDYKYIKDAKVTDMSVTGMGFSSGHRLSLGARLRVSIQFKKLRFDVGATVVRAFGAGLSNDEIIYGAEIDAEEFDTTKRFLEKYIASFTPERCKDSLTQLALTERYSSPTEGFEMFSLLLSLFKDITHFGNQENFVENMLEEICRILTAQRASIFLINPNTNELEAVAALGLDKSLLKFDYRKGIAGSVFTTGVALNIDTIHDNVRFSEDVDKVTGFTTKSVICHPISNHEDKIIGVLEVLNKRNQDRFTAEDEKTMKVLSLIFSSVFHNYNPISERSMIRRFSTPYDREYALLGKSPHIGELRKSIVRLKDIDTPLLIEGEHGTGKSLLATIIHCEGKRGLHNLQIINCSDFSDLDFYNHVFGNGGALMSVAGGTIAFKNIDCLNKTNQMHLFNALTSRRIEGEKITIDVRPIFTTAVDLKRKRDEGVFHQELYDMMSTTILKVKPLRMRKEDMPELISYFLKRECKNQGLLLKELSDDVKSELTDHDWPGNMTELAQSISRLVLFNPKAHVIHTMKSDSTPVIDRSKSVNVVDGNPLVNDHNMELKDRVTLIERDMIMAEIKRCRGNKSKAAKNMGISREALRKKLIHAEELLAKLDGREFDPSSVENDDSESKVA